MAKIYLEGIRQTSTEALDVTRCSADLCEVGWATAGQDCW